MPNSKIESLLGSYAKAWAANDAGAIASHWDFSEPEPFYKAEEVISYFHNADDIRAYWENNQRFHDAIRLQFEKIHVRDMPGDLAMVFFEMRWDIKFAEQATLPDGSNFASAGKRMGGDNHVLALVKETAAGAKLIGWSETPDAPISYMRRLYEQIADPSVGA